MHRPDHRTSGPVGRHAQSPSPRGLHGRLVYPLSLMSLGETSLYRRLRELEAIQWWDEGRLHDHSARRLADLLIHAADQVPFHQRLKHERITPATAMEILASLPFTTKTNLQGDAPLMLARHQPRRVAVKTTGGSTGQAVTVRKDREAMAMARAAMWLGYGWHGIAIGDRCARFWGVPRTGRRRALAVLGDWAMNRLRFSAFAFDDDDLKRYWLTMQRRRPSWLYGYASMLSLLAECAEREGWDGRSLGVKAAISTSEVLAEPQRSLIERVFGAPCRVEYGCGEIGPIAYECERAQLHVIASDVLLEVLDSTGSPVAPGEVGEVVVTDLNNRAMPLIRYQIGDYAVAGDRCSCGRAFPVLASMWGRAYDYVTAPSGKRYHGEFFMYIFEDLRTRGVSFRGYQIVQERHGEIDVAVVPIGMLTPADRERIAALFAQRLPELRVNLRESSGIPRAPSGKVQVIRNLLAAASAPGRDTARLSPSR